MKDWTAIRERYMRDDLPVRLGGLAANLARIKSFSDRPDHRDVVDSLVDESKFFIEWAAPGASLDVQVKLVELQIQLARWQRAWTTIWADPVRCAAMADEAGNWSEWVLRISGLVPREEKLQGASL
jgi:hypothetical protein